VTAYDLLREAILERRQVTAVYRGLPREFCPHILGTKGDKQHCLGYQFGGLSTCGAIVPGSANNWRCFDVDELSQVALRDGPWFAASNWDGRPTCVDVIDVAVT
jgi:hypothetical protein